MHIGRSTRRLAAKGGAALALAVLASAALVLPGAAPAAALAGGIVISEVAPWASGNSPYLADWFEVTNGSAASLTISGWKMDDNTNSFASSVALNGVITIGPGQSVIFLDSAAPATTIASFLSTWFGASPPSGLQVGTYSGAGVGLSTSGDAVNLFDGFGALQAKVTFGASPGAAPFASFDNAAGLDNAALLALSVVGVNGAFSISPSVAQAAVGSPGTITSSSSPTTSSATTSTTGPTTTSTAPAGTPWPGDQTVQDGSSFVFGGNMSGLIEESLPGATPGVLWAARNGPGSLFRLLWDGTKWVPDGANAWGAGKALRYTDGTGEPDAEGVTFAGSSSAGGLFVASERNNLNNTVSRLAILRYDPASASAILTATGQWDLTADLPPVGANLGLEAITWVPDAYLVTNNFYDDAAAHTYNPADYPNHGSGLFFVGVEGGGAIHAYALDLSGSGFTRGPRGPGRCYRHQEGGGASLGRTQAPRSARATGEAIELDSRALLRRLADADIARGCDRLGAISHLQLGEDVRHVVAHRPLAEEQFASDHCVAPSAREQLENLAFAFGQLREWVGR